MATAKIMVVEDEGIIAKDIQNTLEGFGYDASAIAYSGEEAINKLCELQPDLVLMDIVLKGTMDGIEAAEIMHNYFHIPVIYLTAYADMKKLQRAKKTEPFGYILKPFKEKELHSNIVIALYKHKMEDTLRMKEEMEEKLIQSEKLKLLGELAGGVAHNFNNLLSVILCSAQLLKMKISPPAAEEKRRMPSYNELKQALEDIERASKDGAEIVRKIQVYCRTRNYKFQTAVNINEVINYTLEFNKVRWENYAELKGITFSIQKELSPLPLVIGEASELREAFTNIINNALEVLPQEGRIIIKTFKEDTHICVKIEDNGAGIPRKIRDKIFDPFFSGKGVEFTGLGLSVSYGIINYHRGTISVNSIEGKGTTFTIKLPISKKIVKGKQIKPVSAKKRKARVLLIEDKKQVLNLLAEILVKGGHEVATATSGSKGIELFKQKGFDLVFTDLVMPGISGWQVAKKIKSINGKVPVALISGWNVELKQSEMEDSGLDFIVYKPFEVEQVLNLVQEGMILRDRLKAI